MWRRILSEAIFQTRMSLASQTVMTRLIFGAIAFPSIVIGILNSYSLACESPPRTAGEIQQGPLPPHADAGTARLRQDTGLVVGFRP
jgi:hypothetical protein